MSEVATVYVETVSHRGSSSGSTTYTYAVVLRLRKGRDEKLTDWYDEPRAQVFAAWLRTKLNLPA